MVITNNMALENRPKRWCEVIGQTIPVKVLTQSLKLNEIKPAYLFAGETGSGKTTCGLLLAKRLVCENPDTETQDPCNSCRPCSAVDRNVYDDVLYVDGATDRSISFVRERLKPYIASAPLGGKHRIVILDEVHQLGKDAVSALLTLLERMPKDHPKSLLIMCTTEGDSVDGAIRNRCLPLNFTPIPPEDIARAISEKTDLPVNVLKILAEEANGSFRTMWSYFEVWKYTGEEMTEDVIMKIINGVNTKERRALLQDLAHGDLEKVANRWNKWIKNSARPKVVFKLLLKDIAEIAAKNPSDANWKKYLGILSMARPESAMLPALYTLSGLSLDFHVGREPEPAEGQPTLNSINTAEQDNLIMRLMFIGG
jgi:DNA polymerase-3 subunit gamma/tau